jgi:hypothetical protein
VTAEMIAAAIAALERVADEAARALVLVRALERPVDQPRATPAAAGIAVANLPDPADDPVDDLPTIPRLVLVDDDAPSHAPCPDVETYRAHQTYRRQRRDGTWTCAACDVLAPSRAPTAAPSSIAVRPVNGQAPR